MSAHDETPAVLPQPSPVRIRLTAFGDMSAWILIIVGVILFGLRAPVSRYSALNFPAVVTLLELAGGIFVISGFGIFSSWLFWPETLASELLVEVRQRNIAAGLVLLGLKVFNGLALVGFSVWLALTLGGGLAPATQ